ncbi:MAG TPA: MFS transporter, partial [Ktedonobacterales bacterium]|nr:MFS transporter [Ktedonobacterales bacterium]
NIALPQVQSELHFSPTGLSWVIDAYTLTYGGLLLLGGRAGDIMGRRQAFVVGLAIFTVASMLGGVAPNAGWLIATRALQGVGAAFAGPNAIALIVTNFAEGEQRNRALGIYGAVVSAGASIGLILGGILISSLSWRWVMFINVPFGVAAVLLAPRIIKEPQRNPGHLDITGAITGTGGMVLLVYGFIRAASDGWGDRMTIGSFAIAVVLLAIFVFVEMRSAEPILPLRLFAERNRAGGFLNMMLVAATMFSMFFFLTQFLQDILHFSPLGAGVAFLPWTITLFTVARVIPRLVPRVGMKPIIVVGAVLIACAMLWLTQINAASNYVTGVMGPMLLFGLGAGCVFLPLNMLILTGVRPQEAGAAGGVLQTMMQVGGSLGLAILVSVFGNATRDATVHTVSHVSPQVQAQHVMAHAISSALSVGALFALCVCVVAVFALTSRSSQTRQTQGPVMSAGE